METTYYQCVTPNNMPPVSGWTVVMGCPPAPTLVYVRYPEAILEFKEFGNDAFKAGDVEVAMEQWNKALQICQNAPGGSVDIVVMGTMCSNKAEAEWQQAMAMTPEIVKLHEKKVDSSKKGQVDKIKESLDSASFALQAYEGQTVSPLLEKKARHRLVRAQKKLERWSDAVAKLRGARVLTLELQHMLLEVEVQEVMLDKLLEWGIKMRFGMTTLKNSSTYLDEAAVRAMSLLINDPELGRMATGYVLVEKAHLNIRNALLEMAGCDARVLLEMLRDMSAVLGEQSAGTAILAKCCGPAILTRLERPWGPTEATVAIPLLHGWVQRHARLMKLPEDMNIEQALADIVQYEDDETGAMVSQIQELWTC